MARLTAWCDKALVALGRPIRWCQIDLGSPAKARQFSKKMSELVSILFAVVLGVGLGQMLVYRGIFDLAVLLVAYIAILCSWWGYHYGVTHGPPEKNHILFFVDCGIVFVYWWLINVRSPFYYALLGYVWMFLLYTAWEAIRVLTWPEGKKALRVNLAALALAAVLLVVNLAAGGPSWLLSLIHI